MRGWVTSDAAMSSVRDLFGYLLTLDLVLGRLSYSLPSKWYLLHFRKFSSSFTSSPTLNLIAKRTCGGIGIKARGVVTHALTEKPKDEVDDKDEKFEAAEAAPARHLDDFAPPLRISLIWKGREKERMRETVAG